MPFTHVEIEEHKTRRLALLFVFLVFLYVISLVVLLWGLRLFLGVRGQPSVAHGLVTIGMALVAATIHWAVSTSRLVDRVLAAIGAEPLDADDTYHNRLRNVVEEVSVATGGRYRIESYVMPTTALNACAIADFDARAAIAVTEGLLARLDRSQLESVVGHEAAHIASGDSLTKSVFCGLFALHEEALKRLSVLFSERGRLRVRGRAGALILFVMAVLWVTNKTKRLCELLISREQEYRADAVAVRLTRNPLGLAEALRLISKRWRGIGAGGEALSTIFIMDPGEEYLSEREGLFADLFSTHPPADRRVGLLLDMAHVDPEGFEREIAVRARRPKPRRMIDASSPVTVAPRPWFVWHEEAWKGPLPLETIAEFPGVTPDTWIRGGSDGPVMPASQEPRVLQALRIRYGRGASASQPGIGECPNCRIILTRVSYEGVPIDECPACGGCYVTPSQVSRIFAREDYEFPDSIKRLAKMIPSVQGERIAKRFLSIPSNALKDRPCPECGGPVVRKFYTPSYLVEVEQCMKCGLAWLDRHEREMLQYLYEEVTGRDVHR